MKLFAISPAKHGANTNILTSEIVVNTLILLLIDVFVVYFTFFEYIVTYTKPARGTFEKSLWLIAIYLFRLGIFIRSVCIIYKLKKIYIDNEASAINKRTVVRLILIIAPFFLILLLTFVTTLDIAAVFEPISIFLFYFLLYISLCNKVLCMSSVRNKFLAVAFFFLLNSVLVVFNYFLYFDCQIFFSTQTIQFCNIFWYWISVFTALCQDIFNVFPVWLLTTTRKNTV